MCFGLTRRLPIIPQERSYFLVFDAKAIVLVEMGLPSYRTTHFSHKQNDENLKVELDLLEDIQEVGNLQTTAYKQCSCNTIIQTSNNSPSK